MSSTLRDFANAAFQSKRIRFGDLRRLKRDILPARITTREEAEVLISLDAVVEKADREWRSYLIGTVRDFVVWGLSPVGRVDRQKAEWLVSVLSSGVARKTARTLAHEVAREANHVDDTLVVFAGGRRRKSTLPAARLAAPAGSRAIKSLTQMKATSVTWRRTFPDSEPGTDCVALFEGRATTVVSGRE